MKLAVLGTKRYSSILKDIIWDCMCVIVNTSGVAYNEECSWGQAHSDNQLSQQKERALLREHHGSCFHFCWESYKEVWLPQKWEEQNARGYHSGHLKSLWRWHCTLESLWPNQKYGYCFWMPRKVHLDWPAGHGVPWPPFSLCGMLPYDLPEILCSS